MVKYLIAPDMVQGLSLISGIHRPCTMREANKRKGETNAEGRKDCYNAGIRHSRG